MHYPLYDNILQRIQKRGENGGMNTKLMCATVNNISRTQSVYDSSIHYAEIHKLCIHHYILTNNIPASQIGDIIPYHCTIVVGGQGIVYNTDRLPIDMQEIIIEYLQNPNIILNEC